MTGASSANPMVRLVWLLSGLLAVAIGSIGIVVPGLPTTGFFIIAASCFSKSSPRLERWVLGLPAIGPLVQDYRDGLGMSRRAKVWAIGVMVIVGTTSTVFFIDSLVVRAIVVTAILAGITYIGWRVPTRETVLANRAPEQTE